MTTDTATNLKPGATTSFGTTIIASEEEFHDPGPANPPVDIYNVLTFIPEERLTSAAQYITHVAMLNRDTGEIAFYWGEYFDNFDEAVQSYNERRKVR